MNEGVVYVNFYPSDWLAGTRGMTAAETGVYITLVAMMYERGGSVRNEPARLARLCGASNASFARILQTLIDQGKVVQDGDLLTNIRVGRELVCVGKRSAAGTKAANDRWGKTEGKTKRTRSERISTAPIPQNDGGAPAMLTKNQHKTPLPPYDVGAEKEAIREERLERADVFVREGSAGWAAWAEFATRHGRKMKHALQSRYHNGDRGNWFPREFPTADAAAHDRALEREREWRDAAPAIQEQVP